MRPSSVPLCCFAFSLFPSLFSLSPYCVVLLSFRSRFAKFPKRVWTSWLNLAFFFFCLLDSYGPPAPCALPRFLKWWLLKESRGSFRKPPFPSTDSRFSLRHSQSFLPPSPGHGVSNIGFLQIRGLSRTFYTLAGSPLRHHPCSRR